MRPQQQQEQQQQQHLLVSTVVNLSNNKSGVTETTGREEGSWWMEREPVLKCPKGSERALHLMRRLTDMKEHFFKMFLFNL